MSMNLNTLAFLVRDDVTTCSVRFGAESQKKYTFKITNDLAGQLRQRQRDTSLEIPVVVNTSNGLRIAYVSEIHEEPMVDPENDVVYQWAFQVVDVDAHVQLEQAEQIIASKLNQRRKMSRCQQALAALGISDSGELMKELGVLKE